MIETKQKYCEGTGKKPDKRKKGKPKTAYRWGQGYRTVERYICKVCDKPVALDVKGNLYRHKPGPTEEEKKAKELQAMIKSGKLFTFCAECEQPVFEADYLCAACRAL